VGVPALYNLGCVPRLLGDDGANVGEDGLLVSGADDDGATGDGDAGRDGGGGELRDLGGSLSSGRRASISRAGRRFSACLSLPRDGDDNLSPSPPPRRDDDDEASGGVGTALVALGRRPPPAAVPSRETDCFLPLQTWGASRAIQRDEGALDRPSRPQNGCRQNGAPHRYRPFREPISGARISRDGGEERPTSLFDRARWNASRPRKPPKGGWRRPGPVASWGCLSWEEIRDSRR